MFDYFYVSHGTFIYLLEMIFMRQIPVDQTLYGDGMVIVFQISLALIYVSYKFLLMIFGDFIFCFICKTKVSCA